MNEAQLNSMVGSLKGILAIQSKMLYQIKELNKVQSSYNGVIKETNEEMKKGKDDAKEYISIFAKLRKPLIETQGKFAVLRRAFYALGLEGGFTLLNRLTTPLDALDGIANVMHRYKESAQDSNDATDDMTKRLEKALKIAKKFENPVESIKKGFVVIGKESKTLFQELRNSNFKANAIFADKDIESAKKALKREKQLQKMASKSGALFDDSRITDAQDKLDKARQKKFDVFAKSNSKTIQAIGKGLQGFFKILPMLKLVLKGAVAGFLYAFAAIIGIFILFKILQPIIANVWEALKGFISKVIPIFASLFVLIFEGFQDITRAFRKGGTLEDFLDGVFKILAGVISVAVMAAVTLLGAGLVVLGGIVVESVLRVKNGIRDFFSDKLKPITKIATILGILVAVFTGGWIGILAGAIVFYLTKKLGRFFGKHANGGTVTTPMQLVGERGPELVSLPRNSKVHTNSASKGMVGSTSIVNNITINAKDTSDAELRRIADRLANMITSGINRNTSMRSLGR